jgi:hypothetical protein
MLKELLIPEALLQLNKLNSAKELSYDSFVLLDKDEKLREYIFDNDGKFIKK